MENINSTNYSEEVKALATVGMPTQDEEVTALTVIKPSEVKAITVVEPTEETEVNRVIYVKGGFRLSAVNIEQEDSSVEIRFTAEYGGREMVFCSKNADITKNIPTLKNCGADIRPDDIVKILQIVEKVYPSLPVIHYTKGRGWQRDKDGNIKGYAGVYNYNHLGEKQAKIIDYKSAKATGDWRLLKPTLEKYLLANPKRSAIFLIALSAVLCGYLNKNLLTALVGSSSSGKTTIAKIGVSAFSSIDDETLVKVFSATQNYNLATMQDISGQVVLIDDTSLSRDKEFDNYIYQLAEGRERGRLGRNNIPTKTGSWATSTILTAEKSLLAKGNKDLKGKAGRLIEIPVSGRELFDNSAHAEYMLKLAKENHGLIEPIFIEYILKNNLLDNIEEWHRQETEKARQVSGEEDNIISRLCDKIGIVTATAYIARKALLIDFDVEAVRKFLVHNCIETVTSLHEDTDIEGKQVTAYNELLTFAKEEGIYKDGLYLLTCSQFKDIYEKHLKGICDMREWKQWLKEYMEIDDLQFRDSGKRYYIVKEVQDNG